MNRILVPTLDLHGLHVPAGFLLQQEIEHKIDAFLRPYLHSQTQKVREVRIIVGRGLNSKTKIEGQFPLRYYTENYLRRISLTWRSGGYFDGQDGVLVVSVS